MTSACSTIRIGSDHDRDANFSAYHTYAWLPRPHYHTVNPLVVKRAHDAIDAELHSRGYSLAADSGSADFTVNFTVGAHDREDVQFYPAVYRGTWRWGLGYYGQTVDVRQYREGTLAIDVFDGSSHQPVWTGWASEPIGHEDKERSTDALRTTASAILDRFPPK
jgi:hypothetical protein